MNADDRAFINRHARDYWKRDVENDDAMARAYGLWYEITYGDGHMADTPSHTLAIQSFRESIPFS